MAVCPDQSPAFLAPVLLLFIPPITIIKGDGSNALITFNFYIVKLFFFFCLFCQDSSDKTCRIVFKEIVLQVFVFTKEMLLLKSSTTFSSSFLL
jgi:hypothetical protein